MTGESTSTPNPQTCSNHKLVKVEGTDQPDGSFTAACPNCRSSIIVQPPKVETGRKAKKPILAE